MASLASVFVAVKPDTEKFEPDLKRKLSRIDAKGPGRRVGASFSQGLGHGARVGIGGAARTMFAPIAAAAAAIGGFNLFKGFVEDAQESAKISRITAAAIESTGGAAKITAQQVDDLAQSLSNKTAVDDELIQTGANLLLTFKNVRNEAGKGNDIFNQATQASLDLSAAGFGSVDSAAKMLGKALNDPIRGLTALGRAGVTFTDQQKEQIRTLVEAGDVLGAQRIIMEEVATQVGGAAEAAAGPMDRLRTIAGNLGEAVGTALLPYLEDLADWLVAEGVPKVEALIVVFRDEWLPAIKAIYEAFRDDWLPVLKNVAEFLVDNYEIIVPLTAAIWLLNLALAANPIVAIVGLLAALAAALFVAYQKSEAFRVGVQEGWRIISTVIGTVWANNIRPILAAFGWAYDTIKTKAQEFWNNARVVWAGIQAAIGNVWRWLRLNVFGPLQRSLERVSELWNGFKAGLEAGIKSVPGIGQLFGGGEGGKFSAALTRASGERAFPLPSGTYRWGRGPAGHGYDAQDLPVPTGTPVFAPTSGFARGIDLGNRSYGKHIQLASGQFGRVILAHLSRLFVGSGFVRAGQVLGLSGSTGNSTGPHLHVEPSRVLSFDSGGWLPPGISLTYNGTGQPERIMAPDQPMRWHPADIRALGEVMGRVVLSGIGSAQHATARSASLYGRSG